MSYDGGPDKLVPKMRRILSEGEGFWLVVTGNSMFPTLRHALDKVYIAPFGGSVKKGDLLLVQYHTRCLLHRVIKRDGRGVYFNGDALSTTEGPVLYEDIIGIVTKLSRNGRKIGVNNILYRLWSVFWRWSKPCRGLLLKVIARSSSFRNRLKNNN